MYTVYIVPILYCTSTLQVLYGVDYGYRYISNEKSKSNSQKGIEQRRKQKEKENEYNKL